MSKNLVSGDSKMNLKAYKEKLFAELQYYNTRISEAKENDNKSKLIVDDASSDSETESSVLIDVGPPRAQLKSKKAMLSTCLSATQELTNLEVMQSEVNILVEPPKIEGETVPQDAGVWREVTAECFVLHVIFSITFYALKGEDPFAPIKYCGLKVVPLKAAQEAELINSVLSELKRPSDAIELLRNYAEAHKSRRSSLARLTDMFGDAFFIENAPSGGILLKCPLMQMRWTLQSKMNPLAPFHHRFSFDIDHLEEGPLHTVRAAHKQLSDPALLTSERTSLLATIINTCLAEAPQEQVSSDQDGGGDSRAVQPITIDNRTSTQDTTPDLLRARGNNDNEVMAPPKSLPKKVKPRTESPSANKPTEKSLKRPIQDSDHSHSNSKLAKTTEIKEQATLKQSKLTTNISKSAVATSSKNKGAKSDPATNNAPSDENVTGNRMVQNAEPSAKKAQKTKVINKKTVNAGGSVAQNNVDETDSNDMTKNLGETGDKKKLKSQVVSETKKTASKNKRLTTPKASAKKISSVKSVVKNAKKSVGDEKVAKAAKVARKSEGTTNNDRNVIKIVKNITNEKGELVKKVVKSLANNAPKVSGKVDDANVQQTNLPNVVTANSNKVESSENIEKNNVQKVKKPLNEQNKMTKTIKKDSKSVTNIPTISKSVIPKKTISVTEKENTVGNKIISTKIPQKKNLTPKSTIKKAPSRVSPRKQITKARPPLAGVNIKAAIQKSGTGIPRLLTKPTPKVT